MKNKILIALMLSALLVASRPALAEERFGRELKATISNTVEEGKEASLSPREIREEVNEDVREATRERKESLIDKVKTFVKKELKFDARITGTIATVGTNTMTVTGDDGKTYTVNVTSTTKLVRRFGGKSELTEFETGNKVNVFGKFTDTGKTTIDAKLVRNISIQKKWGAFFGEITSKTDTSFVMKSVNRGDQTVFIEGAKLKNRKEEEIKYSDIVVGHRVRVKGIWDRSKNDLTEVDEIKDFSIPAQTAKD